MLCRGSKGAWGSLREAPKAPLVNRAPLTSETSHKDSRRSFIAAGGRLGGRRFMVLGRRTRVVKRPENASGFPFNLREVERDASNISLCVHRSAVSHTLCSLVSCLSHSVSIGQLSLTHCVHWSTFSHRLCSFVRRHSVAWSTARIGIAWCSLMNLVL